MSFAEDHFGGYRVKFVDIRVNPPGGRRKAAGKGQRAAEVQKCEQKGCDALGDCKAPKTRMQMEQVVPGAREPARDHHWFCQRHAAEFNANYDFFDGMTEAEITAFQNASYSGHKPTWKMGGGLGRAHTSNPRKWNGRFWVDPQAEAQRNPQARERTRLEARAFDEMDLPHQSTPEQVREKYAELVKRFHPDSNGGDRSTEHRLHVVIKAFKALKACGLA